MAKEKYLHGYSTPEQQRLIDQAAHWRDQLILKGTRFAPGTRLLELGCGVGAVLGELGGAFEGLQLHGVDWEIRQLETAAKHLASLGLQAQLRQGDATALELPDAAYDEVWMMWFLEHLREPLRALSEARRVLKPSGGITCIEVDYATIQAEPSTPALRALMDGFCLGMAAGGCSDAGAKLGGWLQAAGFERVADTELPFAYAGAELPGQVDYLLGFLETSAEAASKLPGAPSLALMLQGAEDFRAIRMHPQGRVSFQVHKARAFAPAGAP